jgi:hypothetical protein
LIKSYLGIVEKSQNLSAIGILSVRAFYTRQLIKFKLCLCTVGVNPKISNLRLMKRVGAKKAKVAVACKIASFEWGSEKKAAYQEKRDPPLRVQQRRLSFLPGRWCW